MSTPTPGWTHVGFTFEDGQISVHGLSPWGLSWRRETGSIVVPHPSYPDQLHTLPVYTLSGGQRFAAGELSNGLWCFYVPQDQDREVYR